MLGIPASHVLGILRCCSCRTHECRALCGSESWPVQTLCTALQVHTRHGPTIHAGKVVMATFMPLVANLAVVSRQVRNCRCLCCHACCRLRGPVRRGHLVL